LFLEVEKKDYAVIESWGDIKMKKDIKGPVRKSPFPQRLPGASLIGEEELAQIRDVVINKSPFRHYGIGPTGKVDEFETESARYLGAAFTLALSSGSAALMCALAAIGAGEGDEIIIPAFGWYSDYTAVVNLGARPVFAEIDETLNLDPSDFQKKITPRTKAVIVIHYQGGAADMDVIMKAANEKGIYVIEDLAQAFGGEYKGGKLGTIGDIGITSFQINKTITCGEGGLLITSSKKLFARAVRFHDLGMLRTVFQERIGREGNDVITEEFAGNQYRMSELCGAFILAQFRKLPLIAERCGKAHKRLCDAFIGNKNFRVRSTYKYGDFGTTFFIGFSSKKEASGFMGALLEEGIPVRPSSGCTNMLKKDMITKGRLYNGKSVFIGEEKDIRELSAKTDDITDRFVSIGIGPLYSDEDIDDIIFAIQKVGSMIYEKG